MTEMTTRAFADAIGTDPKSLRKYLRDATPRDQHPGKGGRWVLPGSKTEIAKHRKAFAAWQAEQAKQAAARAQALAETAAANAATAEGTPDAPDSDSE